MEQHAKYLTNPTEKKERMRGQADEALSPFKCKWTQKKNHHFQMQMVVDSALKGARWLSPTACMCKVLFPANVTLLQYIKRLVLFNACAFSGVDSSVWFMDDHKSRPF